MLGLRLRRSSGRVWPTFCEDPRGWSRACLMSARACPMIPLWLCLSWSRRIKFWRLIVSGASPVIGLAVGLCVCRLDRLWPAAGLRSAVGLLLPSAARSAGCWRLLMLRGLLRGVSALAGLLGLSCASCGLLLAFGRRSGCSCRLRLEFIQARGLRACAKILFSRALAPVFLDYYILLVTPARTEAKRPRLSGVAVYRVGSLNVVQGFPLPGFGVSPFLQAVRVSVRPACAYSPLVPVCT
jgi:hypothetical protein